MAMPKDLTLEAGVHHTQVRVRFGDTDPYGIVYFASYFRYCHRAIEEFMRDLGLSPEDTFKNIREGYGLPIVEAWGRFRRPSKYGDLLRIETRLAEVRPRALLFRFEFYPPTGRELMAEGSATLVAIGSDWKARNLPEAIKQALSAAG
jgi:acyl-CoA thioester hydrolase